VNLKEDARELVSKKAGDYVDYLQKGWGWIVGPGMSVSEGGGVSNTMVGEGNVDSTYMNTLQMVSPYYKQQPQHQGEQGQEQELVQEQKKQELSQEQLDDAHKQLEDIFSEVWGLRTEPLSGGAARRWRRPTVFEGMQREYRQPQLADDPPQNWDCDLWITRKNYGAGQSSCAGGGHNMMVVEFDAELSRMAQRLVQKTLEKSKFARDATLNMRPLDFGSWPKRFGVQVAAEKQQGFCDDVLGIKAFVYVQRRVLDVLNRRVYASAEALQQEQLARTRSGGLFGAAEGTGGSSGSTLGRDAQYLSGSLSFPQPTSLQARGPYSVVTICSQEELEELLQACDAAGTVGLALQTQCRYAFGQAPVGGTALRSLGPLNNSCEDGLGESAIVEMGLSLACMAQGASIRAYRLCFAAYAPDDADSAAEDAAADGGGQNAAVATLAPLRSQHRLLAMLSGDSVSKRVHDSYSLWLLLKHHAATELGGVVADTMLASYVYSNKPSKPSAAQQARSNRSAGGNAPPFRSLRWVYQAQLQLDPAPFREQSCASDAALTEVVAAQLHERLRGLDSRSQHSGSTGGAGRPAAGSVMAVYQQLELPLAIVLAKMQFNGMHVSAQRLRALIKDCGPGSAKRGELEAQIAAAKKELLQRKLWNQKYDVPADFVCVAQRLWPKEVFAEGLREGETLLRAVYTDTKRSGNRRCIGQTSAGGRCKVEHDPQASPLQSMHEELRNERSGELEPCAEWPLAHDRRFCLWHAHQDPSAEGDNDGKLRSKLETFCDKPSLHGEGVAGWSEQAEREVYGAEGVVAKTLHLKHIVTACQRAEAVLAHLALVAKQGGALDASRVHPFVRQATVETGRLSASYPFHAIPNPGHCEESRRCRAAFCAPAGKVLLVADWKGSQLKILGHLTAMDGMVPESDPSPPNGEFAQQQIDGADMHSATACKIYPELLAGVAVGDVKRTAEGKALRQSAKALNFGIVFGMTEFGLAKSLLVKKEEGEAYLDKWMRGFPSVAEFSRVRSAQIESQMTLRAPPSRTSKAARAAEKEEQEAASGGGGGGGGAEPCLAHERPWCTDCRARASAAQSRQAADAAAQPLGEVWTEFGRRRVMELSDLEKHYSAGATHTRAAGSSGGGVGGSGAVAKKQDEEEAKAESIRASRRSAIALNHPVQGLEADLLKRALLTIDGELTRKQLDACLVHTVHDEVIVELNDDNVTRAAVEQVVRRAMEGHLPTSMRADAPLLRVPLQLDLDFVKDWAAEEAHGGGGGGASGVASGVASGGPAASLPWDESPPDKDAEEETAEAEAAEAAAALEAADLQEERKENRVLRRKLEELTLRNERLVEAAARAARQQRGEDKRVLSAEEAREAERAAQRERAEAAEERQARVLAWQARQWQAGTPST